MLFIIDGYNLALRSFVFAPALDRGLDQLRDVVFEAVARDCRRSGDTAEVVWDGADLRGLPVRDDPRGVRESFSRAPEKADERVTALAIERRDSGHAITVISSDREVQQDADRLQLPWMESDEYEARLLKPPADGPAPENHARTARIAIGRLVAAGLMDDPGHKLDGLADELGIALAYSAVASSTKPHKRAKALVRWLREYGLEVRGGPQETRAVMVPVWE